MKKLIIFCLLFVPMLVRANELITVNEPSWNDFAPNAFVDVKEPKGLWKLNVTAKYWYDRRVEFNNSVDECKAKENSEEVFACFEELKTLQYRKNNDYNAKLEARMNGTSSIPGMEDRTDNMIPINGYLNNMTRYMPSEVR